MSDFDKLLAELSQETESQAVLAKSMSAPAADDKKIEAAAADGDKPKPKTNPEDKEEDLEDDLAKSLEALGTAAAAAGVTMIDGEDFAKSMEALDGRMTNAESVLAKGLESAIGLMRGQSEMIKSMQAQIHELSGQGRGRKTVLAVNERQPVGEPMAKAQGVTVGEVMAKANAAFDAKKITGLELTSLDVSLRNGTPPSEAVLTKILS